MSCSDSPYDNVVYKHLSNKSAILFHKLGLTPNGITFIRLLLVILLGVLIYRGSNVFLLITIFTVSFYLDCVDGTMAKKYNQASDFGASFDSFTDNLTMAVFICALLRCYKCIPIKIIVPLVIYWFVFIVSFKLYRKGKLCWAQWFISTYPVGVISIISLNYYMCAQKCYR